MPITVINLCKIIEDEGFEAIPIGHQSDWRAIDNEGVLREQHSKPVEDGKPAPDIMIHLRIAAYLAGLGEIGFSKMLLTPEFGPRQRVGVIITELELEPDPIYDGPQLCNRCMACVRDCPGQCISATKTVKVDVYGKTLEWSDIDMDKCNLSFVGGMKTEEGEIGTYFEGRTDVKPSPYSPFYKKPRNLYNTGQAVCGARGCTRACMVSLESRGVLKNKFESQFRTKKPWLIDWSDYEPTVGTAESAVADPDKKARIAEAKKEPD
jgi:ferredoxin